MTDILKSEIEGAQSLYTILRNTESVFKVWIRSKMPLAGHDNMVFSTTRDLACELEKIKLGYSVQGPNVDIFHVTLFDLGKKIATILDEQFSHANHTQDIAILFADMSDYTDYGDMLCEVLQEQIRSNTKRQIAVASTEFFNGLEVPIVFLIIDRRWEKSNNLYHGASRNTSRLFILIFESSEEEAALKRMVDESLRLVCPYELPLAVEHPLRLDVRRHLLRHSPKPIIDRLKSIAVARRASKNAIYFPQLTVVTCEEERTATLRFLNMRSICYETLALVKTWAITGQAILPYIAIVGSGEGLRNWMQI